MSNSDRLEISPLSPNLGAFITNVDLRDPSDDQISQIKKAFLDHQVLVFPKQHLKPLEHVAFAKRLGEVMVYQGYRPFTDLPEGMFRLTNDGKDNTITNDWHFDGTYYDVPPAAGILAPQKIPAIGGDTMWANQYIAYERLSEGMKRLLAGLYIECESHRSSRKYGNPMMSATQPAVRKHPETGRLSLNIGSPETGVRFVDMTEAESQPLIRHLYARAWEPDITYRHKWSLGDILMWDNRCTMHYAIHDYGTAEREMYRMTLQGTRPYGPLDTPPT